MHPDAPALEAVASGLDELTRRVVGIADARRTDHDDPWTRELDELERLLRSARRRLERMLSQG